MFRPIRWFHTAAAVAAFSLGAASYAAANASDEREAAARTEPAMQRANQLLASREGYGEAISLYRGVLDDRPDHLEARKWLARVLSWSGEHDAALSHYDVLAARHDDASWIQQERANVLTWSGRYDEAVPIYLSLIARNEGDADVQVALARALKWNAKYDAARAWYKSALELRDDPVVRDEYTQLLERRDSTWRVVQGRGRFFRDSDRLEVFEQSNRARVGLGDVLALEGVAGFTRVDAEQTGAVESPALEAVDWQFIVHSEPSDRVALELGAGARHWDRAPDQLHIQGRATLDLDWPLTLGFAVDHGEQFEDSSSYLAVRRGISRTRLALSGWRAIGELGSLFGMATTSFVEDGNQSVAVYLESRAQPWGGGWPEIVASLNGVGYSGSSDRYYDPSTDLAGSIAGRVRYPEASALHATAQFGLGYGYAKQDGVAGSGLTYRAEAGLRYESGAWSLELDAFRSESQRASVYRTHGGSLRVGARF